ncbi:MAG TPA: response regulator [Bacteroidota bacterium]|nr:response regulator [Bacteroidota bacterium]
MKALIVEDDYTSRTILHRWLIAYGETDVAVDGPQAVHAFRLARDAGKPYDLVCLDIMLPEMDGQAVLRAIRAAEKESPQPARAARIIMTTALNDRDNVLAAIPQCDAYLVKPIEKDKLISHLKGFGFAA